MASPVRLKETSCFRIKMSRNEKYTNCTPTQNQQMPCSRMTGRLLLFCNRPDVRLYHNLIWWSRPGSSAEMPDRPYSGVVGGKALE